MLMERVLAGLPLHVTLVYINDVLVSGRTLQKHLVNFRTVFQQLREFKLKLIPNKCSLFQKKVGCLGHIVSANGVSADPKKAQAILFWPKPSCPSSLRSFLGLCSYYRRFVPSFADVAHPLHKLLEKGQSFEWTTAVDQAFQQLKQRLMQAPVLGYPLPETYFVLDTDASSYATGAVLSQIQGGEERVIAQTLSPQGRQ